MDANTNKKIIELSDEELVQFGFSGTDNKSSTIVFCPCALDLVRLMVEEIKENADVLGSLVKHSESSKSDSHTVVPPHLISEYERTNYYNGISTEPPKLLYHSNLESNPYPKRPHEARYFTLPTRTTLPVTRMVLNNHVWGDIASQIINVIKQHSIQYSVLLPVHFRIINGDDIETFSPLTMWIAVQPGTMTTETAHDASPDIFHIFHNCDISSTMVEWYEGFLLAVVPILIEETDSELEGTIAFYFHEGEAKSGEPSSRVFGESNKHALCHDTTTTIRPAKTHNMFMENSLKTFIQDAKALQEFVAEVRSQWGDISSWHIGTIDWAPKIDINVNVDVNNHHYTLDIVNFQGNIVDLGNKYNSVQLTNMFWPDHHQLRIHDVVSSTHMMPPDDTEMGDDVHIVGKYSNATNFTLGRYSGLEAYICDDFGRESTEVAVLNYDKKSGNFAAKGDSGALIFTSKGRMLAVLHSGMLRGGDHITFGTPAWWVLKQIKHQYPSAQFFCPTFLLA
ncbi:hypothetical protein BDN71DRAFT_1483222 [Pleurotus eryngii]|uniref:Uncharacterized protein n=1 Tax=Pleurotus eryngii TaxID=5323 RepID=A0A9P6DF33_PLEER|nr:hypothetical protein BDN71DRAFT_1483222 [Pleurotus eryngii]